MNTADLITAFFNNEMSPDQERQFLLSVASSDSMRLGLKSHVMLDKLLQEQVELTTVPPTVRTTILREAAVIAAAAASGLAVSEAEAAMTDDVPATSPTAAAPRPSLLARIPRWTAYPMSLLLAVGSFFVGFYTGDREEAANVIESTPLLDLDDQNVTTPSDDPLGNDNASVLESDDVVPITGVPAVTRGEDGSSDPSSRRLPSTKRVDARTPQNGVTASAPSPTEPSTLARSDSDSLNDRNRVNFGSLQVSKPDSTK